MITLVSFARASAAISIGYLLGMVPSADIATKLSGSQTRDLRRVGSENPGALNAGMTLGKKWGGAVFGADVAKGAAAAVVGRRLAGPVGANAAATASVVGHCYPVGRHGGKGVSTSIGQVIGTFPTYLPLDVAVGMVTAAVPKWTQRTWAATATASVAWVASATIAYRRGWSTGIDNPAPRALPIAATLSSAVIARRFSDTPLSDGKPIDTSPG